MKKFQAFCLTVFSILLGLGTTYAQTPAQNKLTTPCWPLRPKNNRPTATICLSSF